MKAQCYSESNTLYCVSVYMHDNTVPSKTSGTKWKYLLTISKKNLDLNLPLQIIWIDIRPHGNVGPDIRSTLFDTQHHVLLKIVILHGMALEFCIEFSYGYRSSTTANVL